MTDAKTLEQVLKARTLKDLRAERDDIGDYYELLLVINTYY